MEGTKCTLALTQRPMSAGSLVPYFHAAHTWPRGHRLRMGSHGAGATPVALALGLVLSARKFQMNLRGAGRAVPGR
jgi:hypothetical protein